MNAITNIVNDKRFILALVIIGVVIIVAIIILLLLKLMNDVRYGKIKSKGLELVKKLEESGTNGIEELLEANTKRIELLEREIQLFRNRTEKIEKNIALSIQKVAIVRYNAFHSSGNDLSYSVALLDYYNDGVIISSIYSQEGGQTYSKPVIAGKSTYTLSTEEDQVLTQAMTIEVEKLESIQQESEQNKHVRKGEKK